jgi:hypothetical protein
VVPILSSGVGGSVGRSERRWLSWRDFGFGNIYYAYNELK